MDIFNDDTLNDYIDMMFKIFESQIQHDIVNKFLPEFRKLNDEGVFKPNSKISNFPKICLNNTCPNCGDILRDFSGEYYKCGVCGHLDFK